MKIKNLKFNFSIKQLIIGFSLIITIMPISLVMYFSHRAAKISIQNFIFDHLAENVTDIKSNLNNLLAIGESTNDTLKGLIETESIKLHNRDNFGQTILTHLKSNSDLMSVEYADEQNETIGAAREIFGKDYAIGISGKMTNFEYQLSEVDANAKLGRVFWTVPEYDAREMPWYKAAIVSNQALWTPIYLWPNKEFGLDFVSPIKKGDKVDGVLDVSIRLNTLESFIGNYKHYPNSQIFLLEKNGLIITGTNVKAVTVAEDGTYTRVKASESDNIVLRDVDAFLTRTFTNMSNINSNYAHSVILNNKKYTLVVDNYNNKSGIDWIIIKAVRDDDLMGEIVANTKKLAETMVIILLTSVLGAIALSNYITRPLTKLVSYSESLSVGEKKIAPDLEREDEIGILAKKIQVMAIKLNSNIAELKNLDKLKDDFLSTTTHELKTPLVPIKSQSQMLLAGDYGKLNPEQYAAIEMIYRNEESLSALTNEVLDISKMKSNRFSLKLKSSDLKVVVNEVIQNMIIFAKEKNISLEINMESNLPKIDIDELRIKQALSNLVANAIKFSPEKSSVKISVAKSLHSITITVVDAGIGISAINISKLFTPFFQIDSKYSRKYRGTGLGLAISKGIIDSHGGEIWAKSNGLNQGSEFGFSLPIKKHDG